MLARGRVSPEPDTGTTVSSSVKYIDSSTALLSMSQQAIIFGLASCGVDPVHSEVGLAT